MSSDQLRAWFYASAMIWMAYDIAARNGVFW